MEQELNEDKKILYIDDEIPLLELYKEVFKRNDFTVFDSDTIKEGIVLLKKHKPDVVLLDLVIAGSETVLEESGFVFLKQVKADPDISEIPVVVFSNLDTNEDRKKAQQLGAAAYLLKRDCHPLEVVEVIEIVRKNKGKKK